MIEVALPGATALFTGRAGGVSEGPYASLNLGFLTDDDRAKVDENRRRVAERARAALAQGRQVHGTAVARVGEVPGGLLGEADGAATALEGVAPIVLTADCLPVALAGGGAVAMLHAGWKGLADGVLEEGVRALRELGGDGDAEAVIGPGAGACCYQVGAEVAERFPHWAMVGTNLDLKAVAATRLREAGVARVHDVGRCTMCEPEVFFSHRRSGGVTGRQAGLVWRS
ncbi:MAG: polyphenol oxidase family protein [Solirubrobacterales bacterium]|nr:polyphenol oxidase family protein [Solirubrobacterales bacterium]